MNRREGLTVQDAGPVRIATVQDDSKLSAWHFHETRKLQAQEQANATDDAFRALLEKGPGAGQSFGSGSHYTEPSKEDHKFSAADLGIQAQESRVVAEKKIEYLN